MSRYRALSLTYYIPTYVFSSIMSMVHNIWILININM